MTDSCSQIDLTILIPFHHEETTITKVLHKLHNTLTITHEVLLIHDDQDDPTIPIIKSIQKEYHSIQILLNAYKPGVPGALKTGLKKACGKNILLLVADDEGPVLIINPMLELIRKGYDLISATRYAKGGVSVGGHLWGRLFSTYGNRLFCMLTSSQLSDTSCGIKMFRKEILQKIPDVLKTEIGVKIDARADRLGPFLRRHVRPVVMTGVVLELRVEI